MVRKYTGTSNHNGGKSGILYVQESRLTSDVSLSKTSRTYHLTKTCLADFELDKFTATWTLEGDEGSGAATAEAAGLWHDILDSKRHTLLPSSLVARKKHPSDNAQRTEFSLFPTHGLHSTVCPQQSRTRSGPITRCTRSTHGTRCTACSAFATESPRTSPSTNTRVMTSIRCTVSTTSDSNSCAMPI